MINDVKPEKWNYLSLLQHCQDAGVTITYQSSFDYCWKGLNAETLRRLIEKNWKKCDFEFNI